MLSALYGEKNGDAPPFAHDIQLGLMGRRAPQPKQCASSILAIEMPRIFCNATSASHHAKKMLYPAPLVRLQSRQIDTPRAALPLAAKGPRHDGEHAVKRGVYAGSFDPVTNGHLWMINKAVDLFDELIVAVGYNPDKHYTFCADERAAMLRETTRQYTNLRVESFENQFLVDYAQSVGANYIVRGIRTASDYEFERTMRYVNSDLHPDITTIFLLPPREFAEVSSTMVKGLVGPKGWEAVIRQYVPGPVHEKLLQLSPRKPR